MADRFFCPDAKRSGPITLEGAEAAHLSRARRIGAGARVVLFDGEGFAVEAEVVAINRGTVQLKPVGPPLPDRRHPCEVTLATAVPKGERLDWLVEKATEIGVARLIPIVTERSVVDPRSAKLERLRRTVIEASKQCGRNQLMRIDDATAWGDLLRDLHTGHRFLADPGDGSRIEDHRIGPGEPACLAIGPEGGFTDRERVEAAEAGWLPVSLGTTLLRIETAGLVGSARILGAVEGRDR